MRPINSSYDTDHARSRREEDQALDADTAQAGDALSYEAADALDDMGYDDLRRRLSKRGLRLVDTGGGLAVEAMEDQD